MSKGLLKIAIYPSKILDVDELALIKAEGICGVTKERIQKALIKIFPSFSHSNFVRSNSETTGLLLFPYTTSLLVLLFLLIKIMQINVFQVRGEMV